MDSDQWTVNGHCSTKENMSTEVRSYKDLIIWQKSIDLVVEIYKALKSFPREELYALSDQIKRSAVSVPSNIAEGQSRQHTGEFRQFLYIALGSLAELDTQLIIAHKLGYIDSKNNEFFAAKVIELRKMVSVLISKLKN